MDDSYRPEDHIITNHRHASIWAICGLAFALLLVLSPLIVDQFEMPAEIAGILGTGPGKN
ncbi:MAG: hypothetical protein QNJ94_05435 [Alphaproteobacteria bacterium]|nr:hypothetical protein [Alphaproteobacteria bacterium]